MEDIPIAKTSNRTASNVLAKAERGSLDNPTDDFQDEPDEDRTLTA